MPILSNFWLGFHKNPAGGAGASANNWDTTGGVKTTSGDWVFHKFEATGSLEIDGCPPTAEVYYMVVSGGGGGGNSGTPSGGG